MKAIPSETITSIRMVADCPGGQSRTRSLRGNWIQRIGLIGKQFAKFALVGLSGMFISLAILNLFMAVWVNFPAATAAAFLVAVSWNFLLNRRFTFGASDKPIIRQWAQFVLACLAGAILNWVVSMALYYSLAFFKEHFNYAALAGVAASCMANFAVSRRYVFRRGTLSREDKVPADVSPDRQEMSF